MPDLKFFSALFVSLLAVAMLSACSGPFTPNLPPISKPFTPIPVNQAVADCLARASETTWPRSDEVGVIKNWISPTPFPTRTLSPDAQLPNSVLIEASELGPYTGRGSPIKFVAQRAWKIDDRAKVELLYCTILKLSIVPTGPRICKSASPRYDTFKMLFKRDNIVIDDFVFLRYLCGPVYFESDPNARANQELGHWSDREKRFASPDFWHLLTELLGISEAELLDLTEQDYQRVTRQAEAEATVAASAEAAAIAKLTRTSTPLPRALTRQANRTRTAQPMATPSP